MRIPAYRGVQDSTKLQNINGFVMVVLQSSFSSVVYPPQEEEYKDQAGQNNFSFAYVPGLHSLRLTDFLSWM